MKAISVFAGLFLAAIGFAADPPTYQISCGVKKFVSNGNPISIGIKGYVTGRSGKPHTLENATVGYTVYADDGEVYATEEIEIESLDNNPKYNPRKYTDHVQFQLPSKLGSVDLIYPASLGKRARFEAYVVMTYIKDHFGGTAKVFCSRKKVD